MLPEEQRWHRYREKFKNVVKFPDGVRRDAGSKTTGISSWICRQSVEGGGLRLVSILEKFMGGMMIMTRKNFVTKGILPLAAFLTVGYLCRGFYIVEGVIDWFRMALLFGIPVGIPHMAIRIHGGDYGISGTVGAVAFCCIIGGLFGSIIAAGLFFRAVFYLVGYPLNILVGSAKRKCRGYSAE